MPFIAEIPEEERNKYKIHRIEVDPCAIGNTRYHEDRWECRKITSMKENLKIAAERNPSLRVDFAFLECLAPDTDLVEKEMLVPSLPQDATKQDVVGVGYGGTSPASRHEEFFADTNGKQAAVMGKLKHAPGELDAVHTVPTKPGFAGTHLSALSSPPNTFQYVHSRAVSYSKNGALSTSNPVFAEQYKNKIYPGKL